MKLECTGLNLTEIENISIFYVVNFYFSQITLYKYGDSIYVNRFSVRVGLQSINYLLLWVGDILACH
jgi:hypothetical protein